MKFKYLLPLILFVIMAITFWFGLYKDPHEINSPLIDKPLPEFSAHELMNSGVVINKTNFLGKITILNVFATWCVVCREENLILMDISHKNEKLQILGLNYRDKRADTKLWLSRYGNPYDQIIFDPKGAVAIELGVYGTPETFLIDKKGIIRYKHIGTLTESAWLEFFEPLINELERE